MNKIQNHLREFYVDKKGYPYVAKSNSPEMTELNWLNSIKDRVQPQSKTGWGEYDKIQLSEAIQMIESNGTWIRSEDAVKKVSNWLKSLKDRAWSKQEWSEEDETALGDALWCCKQAASIAKDENDMGNIWYAENWLRSLKDRIQLQHRWKQENTDDLTDFENAMMHIGGSFFGENAGLDPNDTNTIKEQANILLGLVPKQDWSEEDDEKIRGICMYLMCSDSPEGYTEWIAWLKSIKDRVQPQPKQEWSEEDETKLQEVITHVREFQKIVNPANETGESDLTDWLKSFKPQNTWKPSGEQMEAFEHFVRSVGESGYASPYDNNTKLLYSLLKQLKKLKEE